MSSSNEVSVAVLEETTAYGVLEVAGNFITARFENEGLSGEPVVEASGQIRDDRQNSGQSVMSQPVGGPMTGKLSSDPFHTLVLGMGMMGAWSSPATDTDDFTVAAIAKTITKAGGTDLTTLFAVGDIITLSNFTETTANAHVVVAIVTATVITYFGPDTIVDSTSIGAAGVLTLHPYIEIGKVRRAISICKNFTDLTNNSISYMGMRVGGFTLTFAYNAKTQYAYTFAGNGHDTPALPLTNGRTITAAGTQPELTAGQDIGVVVVDGAQVDFCIQKIAVTLANNLQEEGCITSRTPNDQKPYAADVTATITAVLADENFGLLAQRVTQSPISITYYNVDADGKGYGIQIPRLQLTFPDPAVTGPNSPVLEDIAGTASHDSTMDNTFRLYDFSAA